MEPPDARAFEGTWKLIPERCVYQHAQPPREGTYRISATPQGLVFTRDWVDAQGAAQHSELRLCWGEDEPASLELVDPHTLNTSVEQDEQVVSHASRRLSEDGAELQVLLHSVTPEGRPFLNRDCYRRVR